MDSGNSFAVRTLVKAVETLAPNCRSVRKEVEGLRREYPYAGREELARCFARRARRRYTAAGAASVLPSVIPGVGIAAQIAVEAGAVLGDVQYMIRQFADVVIGVSVIYGRQSDTFDSELFFQVLGVWSKALKFVRDAAVREGMRRTGKLVAKHVSRETIKRINHLVGKTVVTKYGTKRGFCALGRVIPCGVGVVVGGAFNYGTISAFSSACIEYFERVSREPGADVCLCVA